VSKSKQTPPCAVFSRASTENPKEADLYVLGAIPDLDWNTYDLINTDDEFINAFKELEREYDRINIKINSPGGVITDGLAMYNTIKASKKDIHTYNLGLAASMGSVLLLAGKTIHAPASSITMIHSAMGGVVGNKDEIRDYADMLEVYESAIIKTISSRLKKSDDEVRNQFFDGKDHFMTGDKAHSLGLVDVLEDFDADVPDGVSNMTYDQIVNHYSKSNKSQKMDLKAFFSGTAKAEKNTVEVEAKELEQLRTASEEAVNKIDALEAETATLTAEIDSLKATAKTSQEKQVAAENALKASQETLATEQAAHKATTESFEAFKGEAGATHTSVEKDADDYNGGGAEMTQIQKDEAAARAQGEKISKHIKK